MNTVISIILMIAIILLALLYIICAPIEKLYFYISRRNANDSGRYELIKKSQKIMCNINTVAMIIVYCMAVTFIVWFAYTMFAFRF